MFSWWCTMLWLTCVIIYYTDHCIAKSKQFPLVPHGAMLGLTLHGAGPAASSLQSQEWAYTGLGQITTSPQENLRVVSVKSDPINECRVNVGNVNQRYLCFLLFTGWLELFQKNEWRCDCGAHVTRPSDCVSVLWVWSGWWRWPVLSWSRHLTQWTSPRQWDPEWEQAAQASRVTDTAQLITNTTGTQEPDTDRPPDTASGEPRDVSPAGDQPRMMWGPRWLTRPRCVPRCALIRCWQTQLRDHPPLCRHKQPFLGQHQPTSKRLKRAADIFMLGPVSVQFCDKRSVDTRGLGVNEELFGSPWLGPVSLFACVCLCPANMVIYTGPCQDHGAEENTISVPKMMARQRRAKTGKWCSLWIAQISPRGWL